ncbi:MAG: hypothetical protein JWN93_3064 [Hyphomicrobiales bacterium]|nr:hypothetical protein [Hyphomicrobiales bacterium]
MSRLTSAVLAFSLALCASAWAETPPKKPDPKNEPKPAAPSALRGNVLPHCEPGTYPASHVCKKAPPGFYAPAETRFPVPCPDGTTSAAGSRGLGECMGPGTPKPPPTAAKSH